MLRSILTVFISMLVCGLQSCSSQIANYSSEVNFLYKEAQGTIAVKSTGYGKNQQAAVVDAQKNAFNVILFRGLPGTDLNAPLVDNESEAKSKHRAYFQQFFEQSNYKTFMMSSTESSNLIKIKGTKKITVDIKINYNSLRKDLEQKQIIRKFGY